MRVRGDLEYAYATELLRREFKGKPLKADGHEVTVEDIRVEGRQGAAVIALDFSIPSGFLRSTKGTAYLTGRPHFDAATGTLLLEELDYSVETKTLLITTYDWFQHENIRGRIRDRARWQAGAWLGKGTRWPQSRIPHAARSGGDAARGGGRHSASRSSDYGRRIRHLRRDLGRSASKYYTSGFGQAVAPRWPRSASTGDQIAPLKQLYGLSVTGLDRSGDGSLSLRFAVAGGTRVDALPRASATFGMLRLENAPVKLLTAMRGVLATARARGRGGPAPTRAGGAV